MLFVSSFTAAEHEVGKTIGSALDALLLGFSGFVLQDRSIPVTQNLYLTKDQAMSDA